MGSAGKQMLQLSQNVFLLLLGASAQALLGLCEARIVLGLPPSWRQGFWKLSILSHRSEFLPLVQDEIQVFLCYK